MALVIRESTAARRRRRRSRGTQRLCNLGYAVSDSSVGGERVCFQQVIGQGLVSYFSLLPVFCGMDVLQKIGNIFLTRTRISYPPQQTSPLLLQPLYQKVFAVQHFLIMSTLHRIPVPSFDLYWHDSIPEGTSNYILLPGGGGSAKTGVKNQIMVGEYQDDDKQQIHFHESCFTDTDDRSNLCSGLSTGSLPKVILM